MEVRVYKSSNKIKSRCFTSPEGRCCSTNAEILDAIQRFPEKDIKFIDVNNHNKDISYECLLNILVTAQQIDTSLPIDLNKVIRGGGFIEYIKNLESGLQEQP